jgi:uncharacterized protein YeaO (DUF488 family)
MIRTKSIYDPADEEDGLRVLVTRYWPRGVRKERSHLWLRDLGPSPALIRAWKAEEITWHEFSRAYLEEFSGVEKQEALDEADTIIKEGISGSEGREAVTLLCTCRDGTRCHRAILKEIIEARYENS